MKFKMHVIVMLSVIGFFTIGVYSHARLADNSDVIPRGTGMKDSPCGENIRTSSPKILNAGSTIIIRWIETVDHTGSYWIEYSKANDKNWIRLKTISDEQNNAATLPHLYEAKIVVPSVNCDNCTLRLVQEMVDGNPNMPSYYYSCGDIKIINGKC